MSLIKNFHAMKICCLFLLLSMYLEYGEQHHLLNVYCVLNLFNEVYFSVFYLTLQLAYIRMYILHLNGFLTDGSMGTGIELYPSSLVFFLMRSVS